MCSINEAASMALCVGVPGASPDSVDAYPKKYIMPPSLLISICLVNADTYTCVCSMFAKSYQQAQETTRAETRTRSNICSPSLS
jgi:hypothetical protein